jgi:hypothetical protein
MKGTVSNCHAPLDYPYTRGDHCWRVTGTTAFAAALICRYPYDAPRRKEDASENRAGSPKWTRKPATASGSPTAGSMSALACSRQLRIVDHFRQPTYQD